MSVVSSLPRLLVLLLLTLGLTAADKKPEPPPSLDGYVFALAYLPEKNKAPKTDKLTFTGKSMQLASLPDLTFSLKLVRKGRSKEIDFSGSATDAMGTVIEIDGKVEIKGDDVHGSVTRRPKKKDEDDEVTATAVNFGGKVAVLPNSKK